ncbi:sugar ABC transporter ATP-binding protein [Pseudonocardia aurantiaca]|uniref:Sugar ABC transporter ATP-binding protein n=1 Tax=Pseudonocardia aurantiaca TaxID=75290 RepID=A0ABW4FKR1_9PSEU
MDAGTPALSVDGLGKQYGRQRVLESVSFSLRRGEVAALLGENGAGKSTMAKVLAGAISPDHGTVAVDGRPVTFASPRSALLQGISFMPQELIYVPRLTVAENICLGRLPGRLGSTSPRAIRRRAQDEAQTFDLDLPLDRSMDSLPLAQQQQVEILKALARRSRILLLDEPTAALSSRDSDQLLQLTTTLAARGVAVLYISHRLDEVFRVCDTAHVLRNGRLVSSSPVRDTSPREVIEHMLGRPPEEIDFSSEARPQSRPVLELTGWHRDRIPALRDVSLVVGEGEIVGLYGVRGSGAETIAETLGGLHADVTGGTVVSGRPLRHLSTPLAAHRAGISYVPADRKSQGLVAILPIVQSLSLAVLRSLTRLGVVRRRREAAAAAGLAEQVQLRARSLTQPVGELSGGNQQKVLVGSRLAAKPKVLVLQEPTRGVDVGARLELHRLLRALADEGTGQLLVTSDVEEAVGLSDRLLVVRDGRIVHEITHPTHASQPEALQAAGGPE